MASQYVFVSFQPLKQGDQATQKQLKLEVAPFASCVPLTIPQLKVGRLDTLVQLSDDLQKLDTQLNTSVSKFARSYKESHPPGAVVEELKINTPEPNVSFLPARRFDTLDDERWWNLAHFPLGQSLKDLKDGSEERLNGFEEDFRKLSSVYFEHKSALAALVKKESGTLIVRSLTPYVHSDACVETTHITTVFVVIPKPKEQEFLSTYETMEQTWRTEQAEKKARNLAAEAVKPAEAAPEDEQKLLAPAAPVEAAPKPDCLNIVPATALKLYEDAKDGLVLYRLVILKKGLEAVKAICRDRRYTLRQHTVDLSAEKTEKEQREKLERAEAKARKAVIDHCKASYGELAEDLLHIKCMRVFVESVLRFGLKEIRGNAIGAGAGPGSPHAVANFQAAVLKVKPNQDKKLHQALQKFYASTTDNRVSPLAGDEDKNTEYFDYVYIDVTLD